MSPTVIWREGHPDLFFIEFEELDEPMCINAHHAFDLHSELARAIKRRADWKIRRAQDMEQRRSEAKP